MAGITTVMYHGLIPREHGERCEKFYSIYQDTFEQHLKFYRRYYTILHPEEFYNKLTHKEKLPKRSILLTFDDGLQNFFEFALPILKKYKVVPILFCNSANLNQKDWLWFSKVQAYSLNGHEKEASNFEQKYPALNLESIEEHIRLMNIDVDKNDLFLRRLFDGASEFQIKAAVKEGSIVIGGHTENHPRLANEDIETVKSEIENNKSHLEKLTNHHLTFFSYPQGDYNPQVATAVKNAGYKVAFATDTPPIKLEGELNSFALPRIGLYRSGLPYLVLKMIRGVKYTVD